MKTYLKRNLGFTLIELLVVISIIGLLAAIILVSLNSARQNGNNSRITEETTQLRNQLEVDRTTTTGLYNADLTAAPNNVATPSGTNMSALITDIKRLAPNGAVTIWTSAAATKPVKDYVIYSETSNGYFCLDSAGNSYTDKLGQTQFPTAYPSTGVICPSSGTPPSEGGGTVTVSISYDGASQASGTTINPDHGAISGGFTLGWTSNGTSCDISDSNGAGNYSWNPPYPPSGSIYIAINNPPNGSYWGDYPDSFTVSCSSGGSGGGSSTINISNISS